MRRFSLIFVRWIDGNSRRFGSKVGVSSIEQSILKNAVLLLIQDRTHNAVLLVRLIQSSNMRVGQLLDGRGVRWSDEANDQLLCLELHPSFAVFD